jgi:uncharacterized surface anchored protein
MLSLRILTGLLCLSVCTLAQRGEVHGLIQDAGGVPVAGAQVLAHNSGENTDRVFVSAADGSFALNDLKPGHYQIQSGEAGVV